MFAEHGMSVSDVAVQADDRPAWMVAHVKPRCEKKLAAYCEKRGVENYLPLRREVKIYQRRKVSVYKPLFSGYVFLRMSFNGRAVVMESGQITRLLKAPDSDRLAFELEQIKRVLEIDPGISACQAVEAGVRVRITTGPLIGIEGVVELRRDGGRLVVNVEMINRGVAVQIDADAVERID